MDEKAISQALDVALHVQITDSHTYEQAVLFRESLKALRKEIDSAFDPQIESAHATHKAALAAKKKYIDPVTTAENAIKTAVWKWERDEAQRIADERASLEAIGADQLELIEITTTTTTYARKVYSAVVVDKMALLRAVLEGKVDHNLVVPDQGLLNAMAAKTHELFKVPGCTVDIREVVCSK